MKKIDKNIFIIGFFFLNFTIYSQCFSSLSSTWRHNVALKQNGTIWGWGFGSFGQLNNGVDGFNEYSPISLSLSNDWMHVTAGEYNTFAIKSNGTLYGCGNNNYGNLGINSTTQNIFNLVQIGTSTNWKEIAPSNYFTIGLRTDNTIWGTGQNDGYQMGSNTCCNNQLSFIQIGTANDWKTIAVSGARSAFAIKNNGTLWGWGSNIGGLLGYSNVSSLNIPTQLNADMDWNKIAVGNSVSCHALILKTNGTLWSWGGNQNGERGIDPQVISGGFDSNQILGTWTAIAAGFRMSFGIKSNGTLWGWGLNSIGQLGNGTTTNTFVPTQVGTSTNWQSVSCGYQHVVALRADGSLWSWGNNDQGQLGNGTATGSNTPSQVTVTGCTLGTDEFELAETKLIVSPNPVDSELSLSYKGAENVDTIIIFDMTGKEVFRIDALGTNSFQTSFGIGSLQVGTYIVSLKNGGSVVGSKQFIKK